ncbi:MAG: ribosome maturation factor RimP [Actinobacteria bacterium]|nr:ribosome maturation factor RimP [Actinomycetota bacterium]
MTAGTHQRGDLAALLHPVVTAAGYDLDAVTVSRAGRRSLVRIVVDGDNGVSLDAVAEISRAISRVLDEHEGLLGSVPYLLEVTSPGVDRPLTEPRHWRRAAGRRARVTVAELGSVEGRVLRADDRCVVLDIDGATHEIEHARLGPGTVQVEFTRPGGASEEDEQP